MGFGASLVISPSGNGLFTLQGVGLTDVQGIDATISYDSSTLSGPQVVQGGLIAGAMMVANPNVPGIIRIAVVKAVSISGSGIIATINFSNAAGGTGNILSLNANVINSRGARLDVQTQIVNPVAGTGSSDSGSTTQSSTDATASNSTTGTGQHYLGPAGAILPSESAVSVEQKPSPMSSPDPQTPYSTKQGPTETAMEPVPENQNRPYSSKSPTVTCKTVIHKSVLEAFREFKGKRTLKALTTLFEKASIPGVRQEPAIALSDGKTRVKVYITIASTGKDAPNFAVKSAKLVSLKRDNNAWIIETLPDRKTYDSSVIVLDNGILTTIPLTVAPPIDLDTGKINISDAILSDRNKSGTGGYINDYIITANYLFMVNSLTSRSKVEKK